MKKSAVNTFGGGLNFDLNPLNTPSDILTDCLNGTLITFNADELTLQNDAGNTDITINYPSATPFSEFLYYRDGDIVYNEVGGKKFYYKNISGLLEDNSPLDNDEK
jgi:hypothetical protein